MNCKAEKWLTIVALTGWLGSMGTMVVFAVNTPPEARIPQLEIKSGYRIAPIKQESVRLPIDKGTQFQGRTALKGLESTRQQWFSKNKD
jgi:hypothetical protein